MQEAFDIYRRTYVLADSAEKQRMGHYLCPRCRDEVYLAKGLIRAAHFKHQVGDDHSDCEYYCGGVFAQRPFAASDRVDHSAKLVCTTNSSNELAFAIRLLLRRKVDKIQLLEFSKWRSKTVHCHIGTEIFWLDHIDGLYELKLFADSTEVQTILIDGFLNAPLVFRKSQGLGAYVPPHILLKPGEHYVIYPKDKKPDLSQRLSSQSVPFYKPNATTAEWEATQIVIPEKPDVFLQLQIREQLGYGVDFNPVAYSIVRPNSVRHLGNDSWEVEADRDWNLTLEVHGRSWNRRILIQRNLNGDHSSEEIFCDWDTSNNLVAIAGSRAGAVEGTILKIGVTNPLTFVTELIFSSLPTPDCGRLYFTSSSGKAYWAALEAQNLLREVSLRKRTALKLSIPAGVQVEAVEDGRCSPVKSGEDMVAVVVRARNDLRICATGFRDISLAKEAVRLKRKSTAGMIAIVPLNRVQQRRIDAYNRGAATRYAAESRGGA